MIYYTDNHLTKDARARLLVQQAGHCALCNDVGDMHFKQDNDRDQGIIRGLLCPDCKLKLKSLEENKRWLTRLMDYLANPPTKAFAYIGYGTQRPLVRQPRIHN